MRRFQIPNAALVAGLAVLFSGCSGETPTAPSSGGGNGGNGGTGSCTAHVSLTSDTQSPLVGSVAIVRAIVTRSGVPVPDGSSVQYTTDLGFFNELGIKTVSKTIVNGVADVTVGSFDTGTAHVKAVFDCASAQINLNFGGVPDTGPFISSISPTTGSCAGGDTVTILGGRFGDGTNVDVLFGGVRGSIKGTVTNTQITVTTPARTLKDPAVPETVPVVVRVAGLASPSVSFTFACIPVDQRIFISTIAPTEGASAGGDVVQINGGHFGGTIATTRVTFCGRPAQITGQQDQQITVSTPASPAELEVCDVVVTRDLGLVSQQSATSPQQFTYRRVFTPVINSSSPKTGPNDASTRVTIFGSGFQFPMQVFLTGGACGQQLVEAEVSDITLTTIVFKTPVAVGGNVCLANQLVDIVVKNPLTGKTASCPACFKYYSCPTITSIAPGFGPYTGGTQVIITGHNFEEPAIVNGGGTAWGTISVSSQQIIAVTPPLIVTGCSDVSLPVLVNGTSLNCPNAVGPDFTYYVKSISPFITNISPSSVPEAGAPGVVITGGNFFGNVRVVVKLTPSVTVFPTTQTLTQITFPAPQFTGTFLTTPCTTSGGGTGTRNIPTAVDVDVLNVTTTCTSAVEQITYIPADLSCKTGPLTIATSTLPNGTVGTAYSQTVAASGGTGVYAFSLGGGTLPAGLGINATGIISGTPTAAGTSSFTVTVSDGATTASKVLSITIAP
jgi:hypothetical protein